MTIIEAYKKAKVGDEVYLVSTTLYYKKTGNDIADSQSFFMRER